MLSVGCPVIGSDNIKHNSKYFVWQRLEYCPAKTTVQQRLDLLKLEVEAGKTNIDSEDGT